MTRTIVHRNCGFIFALLLCATAVGAAPQVARFNDAPPQPTDISSALGSYEQLQPLW
jgi:hypothetical protein